MKKLITTAFLAGLATISMVGNAQADTKFQAQQAKPQFNLKPATGIPKPAQCAPGFTVIGKKLIQHEGKKWYEYSCAREIVINRTCNQDTQVTDVKDNIISLPSDGKSKKSKIRLSYKCFNYVPVE